MADRIALISFRFNFISESASNEHFLQQIEGHKEPQGAKRINQGNPFSYFYFPRLYLSLFGVHVELFSIVSLFYPRNELLVGSSLYICSVSLKSIIGEPDRKPSDNRCSRRTNFCYAPSLAVEQFYQL